MHDSSTLIGTVRLVLNELLTFFREVEMSQKEAFNWVSQIVFLSLLAEQVHYISYNRKVEMQVGV